MTQLLATPSDLETYCDVAAKSRWGAYITEIERHMLLDAHELAGEPTVGLEIGCEGGRWTRLLTDLSWDMTCTEVNPATLAVCRQKVPTARCVQVSPDDSTLPCESGSVRLLVCIEVPAVMASDWFPAEADRVLADDGDSAGSCLVGPAIRPGSLRSSSWSVRWDCSESPT